MNIALLGWIFFFITSLTFPNGCEAFTWGDFHVFAVIFFSFLGGFLGLGAIFGAIYFACGKPFLNRFQDEVAETHREHHPWPPGSARWRLQQMVKSERRSGETRFSAQKTPHEFASTFPSQSGFGFSAAPNTTEYLYQRALDCCGVDRREMDCEPIITSNVGEYYPQQQSYEGAARTTSQSTFERPTYFTPTPEKTLPPVREEVEEYRVVREESFVSSGGGTQQQIQNVAPNIDTMVPDGIKVIRTTSTVRSSSRRRKSPSRLPNTYI